MSLLLPKKLAAAKKNYKYKTLERGGGWGQSNQKIIEITSKKSKKKL